MGAEIEIQHASTASLDCPHAIRDQPQLKPNLGLNSKDRLNITTGFSTSTILVLSCSITVALFSYFFYHGIDAAFPPPEELPPLITKKTYFLHYFLIAPLLLNTAILVGSKLPRKLRKFSNALFAAAILRAQWEIMKCGTRSSAMGFATGTFVAFLLLQMLDLLFLSDPVEEFARVPVQIRTMEIERIDGKEVKVPKGKFPPKEQGFPLHGSLLSRIAWTLDLTNSMRLVGWKAPIPTTPDFHHESVADPAMYISRSRFLAKQFLSLLIMGFVLDFLVWNVRFNDTAFYFPSTFPRTSAYKLTGFSGGDTAFTANFQTISVYPPGIFPKPIYPTGFDPSLTPYPKYFPPLSHPTALSSPLYHFIYTASLFTFRFICQCVSIYIAIRLDFTVVSILFVLLGLIFHPQPYTIEELSSPENSSLRWFHPLYYPPMNSNFFGSYWGKNGVLGIWSRGWHSLFRRNFYRPGIVIAQKLGIQPDTPLAKLIVVVVAFTLSGMLHYAGIASSVSYHTTPGGKIEQLPLGWEGLKYGGWGTVSFFFAQILGVTFERLVVFGWESSGMAKKGYPKLLPYLWTLFWFMLTVDLFFEEYRWAGMWRTEPGPLSMVGAWVKGEDGMVGGWWRWGRRIGKDGAEWGMWEWSEKDVLGGWGIVI